MTSLDNKLCQGITTLAKEIKRDLRIMEVCGTHTEVIAKEGLRQVMPSSVELVTGPGCPVCVTSLYDIDCMVELALKGISIFCYGDALNLPGSKMSLAEARAQGANVQVVYSTTEALSWQKKIPKSVFFGLGFETTAPMTASAIKKGLVVFSSHKYFPPAMEIISNDPKIKIDGFIDPGHVSAIIGLTPFKRIKKPQVVAGFAARDVLGAIYLLLDQINSGKADVANTYKRLVADKGNKKALALLRDVFEPSDASWRGFGVIPSSGMSIVKKYQQFDAKAIYSDILSKVSLVQTESSGCICDQVIKGLKKPDQCKLFAKKCSPEKPYGACMVSREGACRIKYEYKND